ncbi:TetR family transcriptional regulator [Paenibacillus thiaminolyticus]|uniref:TetR family transcriptional regulator n=1 Tax=Paenibacillus thiaminolyticus TaxID=49283 RepID=A0AAP9J2N1_PANTH|nr:TetR/AcrR family transcriptional regulator [Paenibacillus thiaminolyticus]MCY9535191.1 TetR family transcriptional regulator [Paenibacillus thiaminolyticus]MCY9602452.1 TetR family transcriptional regulator [Paenibacillus thiaminolyticus]MCY9606104.1 TetR family transcriptional regulator [Paenibacillus thiaminolyticus]MCY9612490.1 TetR family transcriptional regulator [Paenibacillus thiaminolyticus]MCY9620881.1 TetR family transcriptional regulator [Paenibacillus thiaminolyticus]
MASQKKEKYSQILEAAVKVFAEHGFHRSQVSRIAKTAGVADGTIYLYFKRKEDILISLFREKLGELIGKFHASLEETTGAKEALRNVCEIHFTEMENNPDFAFVSQIELRQSSLELRKEIGKIIKPYIVLIEKIITQGIEEKVFRADLDVKLTRLLIFGSMDEVVTSWLISGQKYSLTGQLDGTIAFFLKGLEA